GEMDNTQGQVVPPPPSLGSTGSAAGTGRIIALGLNPSATPPPPDLVGNRRGRFAASPEGKIGASGKPEITASSEASSEGVGGRGTGRGAGGVGSGSDSGIATGRYAGFGPDRRLKSS